MQKPSAVIGDWAFVRFSACISPAEWYSCRRLIGLYLML